MKSFTLTTAKIFLILWGVFTLIVIFNPDNGNFKDGIILFVALTLLALILAIIGAMFNWLCATATNAVKHIDKINHQD